MKNTLSLSLSVIALCAVAPLQAQQPAQLRFHEVSLSVGLDADMTNSLDHPARSLNGGASIGDFNNDGISDIFLPSTGVHPDRIFYGKLDDTFQEVVPTVHNATTLYRGVGSTVGDFDDDGWQDIYVTSFGDMATPPGPGANRLYHNNGDSTFTEVAAAAGVSFDAPSIADGFGCCFGDYDLDGDLDLFVCAWNVADQGNQLYRNEGNSTFTEVTTAAGLNFGIVRGFSPRFADLNGDRYPEILMASDFGTTYLFENQRDGSFRDITSALMPDKVHFGMGQALGDFNGDGLLDWYVTSIFFDSPTPFIANGNRLYMNRGNARPMKATSLASGVVDGGWGWGAVAGDFDLDGDVDIAEVNGWEDPEWFHESSKLFINDGAANFQENGAIAGFDDFGQSRGLVSFDYQNDGDLDLLVIENSGPVRLYRNDIRGNTHWLRINTDTSAHPGLAPGGFGTRIRVKINGVEQVQVLDGGTSYLGCSQITAVFGLGQSRNVDRLTVEWPDGFRTVLTDVGDNQILDIGAVEPLSQDASIHRGQMFDTTVRGLIPGENAWFLSSLSGITNHGPGIGFLGNMSLNLRQPIFLMGRASADSNGVATLRTSLAPWHPLIQMATQVVVIRDFENGGSIKSNVVVRQILR